MPDSWDGMALVGRIARAHGNRGQVIVNSETDFVEERFRPGAELFVLKDGAVTPVVVASVRVQQGRPVLGLEGIGTIDAAEQLAGLELRIPADRLVDLPAGTFYRHDLVGCRVEMPDGVLVGIVTDVEGTMQASRLVVDAPCGEVLVPLATAICASIDIGAKRIVIDPPEGLLDVNGVDRGKR